MSEQTRQCPSCLAQNPVDALKCEKCGEEFREVPYILIPCQLSGKFKDYSVKVEGIVTSRTLPLKKIVESVWTCPICGAEYKLEHDAFDPFDCPSSSRRPICTCVQSGVRTGLDKTRGRYVDFAKIKIRDPFERVKGLPGETMVHLIGENAMLGKCNPGEKLLAIGKYQIKAMFKTGLARHYVAATEIQGASRELIINPEDERQIHEWFQKVGLDGVNSLLFPRVYGHDDIKESIASWLTSFGSYVVGSEGLRPHWLRVLLIGDPGTIKTIAFNRLRFLFERYGLLTKTTGTGATDIGLTAAVAKDEDGQWSLIAGPFVLMNDRGLLIDELDKAKKEFPTLTAAMEGEVPISKAGITTVLPSRTAVLAAQNPTSGSYINPNLRLVDQVQLPLVVIDRFDLIFPLMDQPSPETDEVIAEYVITRTLKPEEEEETQEDAILAKYFCLANAYFKQTHISANLHRKIRANYLELRREKEVPPDILDKYGRPIPAVTARAVEVLVKLAKAYAGRNLRIEVNDEDIDKAFDLYQKSLRSSLFDPVSGKIKPLHETMETKRVDILFQVLDETPKTAEELWEKAKTTPTLDPETFYHLLGSSGKIRENWKLRKAIEELRTRANVEVLEGKPERYRLEMEEEDLTDIQRVCKAILDLIHELQGDRGASKIEIMDRMEQLGVERSETARHLNDLKEEGTIYEVDMEHVRTTRM